MSGVAVLFGGPSPEHDVSILTGLQAARALASPAGAPAIDGIGAGRGPIAIYWSKAGDLFEVRSDLEAEAFVAGVPASAVPLRLVVGASTRMPGGFVRRSGRLAGDKVLDIDVVVNCCHGAPGEDGTLQSALDLAGCAYTGPTAQGAALGMDKLAFGAVVAAAGLPALSRELLAADREPSFPGPYIVKPRFGGSSIGIDVVADAPTAQARLAVNPHLRLGAVVEPFRPDLADIQVALRSYPSLTLSAIERPLRNARGADGEILGYADKYVGGEGMASAPRELPADIPAELGERVAAAARSVAAVVGLRGVARLDFLAGPLGGTGEPELYVNEVNTVPGSLARYLWIDPPVAFADLLRDLIEEARRTPTHAWSSAGADGSVLRSAGSIAGKLS